MIYIYTAMIPILYLSLYLYYFGVQTAAPRSLRPFVPFRGRPFTMTLTSYDKKKKKNNIDLIYVTFKSVNRLLAIFITFIFFKHRGRRSDQIIYQTCSNNCEHF